MTDEEYEAEVIRLFGQIGEAMWMTIHRGKVTDVHAIKSMWRNIGRRVFRLAKET